jgi:pyruvate/2-oxoglutarate dehydrogenase complex dihydrolipoamide dehydrogenase (E3) component
MLNLLVDEQQTPEPSPLYALGDVAKQIDAYSVSKRQSQ